MAAWHPRAAPALSWPSRLALLLLALAYVLPFALANLTADTARDLAAAHRIIEGELPAHGPIIDSALYLGPVWYYLLALGMAMTGSITGTSLFVGVLAAAKFPLAYCAGRELVDARFGFFTALAVALPGPGMLQAVTWTNPVLVEAAAWLFLFACCRSWRRESDALVDRSGVEPRSCRARASDLPAARAGAGRRRGGAGAGRQNPARRDLRRGCAAAGAAVFARRPRAVVARRRGRPDCRLPSPTRRGLGAGWTC